eukprot:SAG22_NODE_592_length_8810_cov_3.873264_6_plen_570_part_01
MANAPILAITRFDPDVLGATIRRCVVRDSNLGPPALPVSCLLTGVLAWRPGERRASSLREFFEKTIHYQRDPAAPRQASALAPQAQRGQELDVLAKLIALANSGHFQGDTPISGTTEIEAIGLDSIGSVDFLQDVNSQFGVKLEQNTMSEVGTFAELWDKIAEQMPAPAAPSTPLGHGHPSMQEFSIVQQEYAASQPQAAWEGIYELGMGAESGPPAIDAWDVLAKLIVLAESSLAQAGVQIDGTTEIEAIGLDSIGSVDFLQDVNSQFGVKLEQNTMSEVGTLAELRDKIVEKMGDPTTPRSRSSSYGNFGMMRSASGASFGAGSHGSFGTDGYGSPGGGLSAIDTGDVDVMAKLIVLAEASSVGGMPICSTTEIEAIGLDSIGSVDFLQDVNSQFGVKLEQNTMSEVGTFAELRDKIAEQMPRSRRSSFGSAGMMRVGSGASIGSQHSREQTGMVAASGPPSFGWEQTRMVAASGPPPFGGDVVTDISGGSNTMNGSQYYAQGPAQVPAHAGLTADAGSLLHKLIGIVQNGHVSDRMRIYGTTEIEAIGLDSIGSVDFLQDVNSQFGV